MEFKELIMERRSVRAYQADRTIDDATIKDILADMVQAPTWKNFASGRYYVANTPESVAKIRACLAEFNQKSTANASAYIVTTYVKDISGFTKGEPDNELGNQWGAYDLGCQNAYLVLSAKEHGLDSLIMGIRDGEKLREAVNAPEEEVVFAVIALGYHEGDILIRRRKAVEDIAKFL